MIFSTKVHYVQKLFGCHWQLQPIMVLQIIFFAVSFKPDADVYLAITPGRVFMPNYYIWTIFTFSFYNYSIFFLLSDLLTLFLLNNLLSFYSWSALFKFCTVVNLTTALTTLSFLYIKYAIIFDTDVLFAEKICGSIALLGGLTVVSRQSMGDKLLLNFPLGNIRYKHIPFMCLVCSLLLMLLKVVRVVPFIMFATGIFVAWVYLRFFQRHDNGVIGDVTDAFTFSGFFPNHLEPPVAILSNAIYSLLLKLKLCKKPVFKSIISTASVLSFTVNIDDVSRFGDNKLPPMSSEKFAMLVTPDSIGLSTTSDQSAHSSTSGSISSVTTTNI
ncbi:hypothetical protein EG68_05257 [Paragonimus skrjabini miyazakii]|uniref:Transmembrane protein 115 n=1 Tax=Paragonimus skrjabini miyazakii TaxID=59628 RepID=A0A8S9YWY7_9TREM|nr:hypothetical protein EG68_05257 [Paragonimus skrjabini miyazakii]